MVEKLMVAKREPEGLFGVFSPPRFAMATLILFGAAMLSMWLGSWGVWIAAPILVTWTGLAIASGVHQWRRQGIKMEAPDKPSRLEIILARLIAGFALLAGLYWLLLRNQGASPETLRTYRENAGAIVLVGFILLQALQLAVQIRRHRATSNNG